MLGWREFVRHVYEEHREHYATANALGADVPLPAWYWGAPSGMRCLDTTVAEVLARGHSHHITRLMVLSNIATLLGVDPQALNRWFWDAYVDAYEWVVTPNVVGMATWADGGIVGSKPYVSSGKYIQRMGPSLCAGCRYDPKRDRGRGGVSAQSSLLGLPGASSRALREERADGGAAGDPAEVPACHDGRSPAVGRGLARAGSSGGRLDGLASETKGARPRRGLAREG